MVVHAGLDWSLWLIVIPAAAQAVGCNEFAACTAALVLCLLLIGWQTVW